MAHDVLRRLLSPRSVAIVGAKDASSTSAGIVEAMERIGFTGELHPVNRSGHIVHGRPAARSCRDIGAPVDVAVVLTPSGAVSEVLEDVGAAGIPGAVVLSSGWAESGPDGRARQDALVAQARSLGITLVGPNCLGYANFAHRTGAWIPSVPPDLVRGSVAIVSQSGGIGNALVDLAHELGVGLSYAITTGNEAMVSTTDAVGYLVDDEDTSVVAVFTEAIRDPPRFLADAARARELGKAIVILKAGSSELAARNAVSHTGSLVGDDRIVDAALRQSGVIRVQSLEELVVTSAVVAHTGALSAPGIGVVSISGGSCDIVADEAGRVGLPLPELTDEAAIALRGVLPGFATVQNPLDITGAALQDEFAQVLGIVEKQDDVGAIAVLVNVPSYPSVKGPTIEHLLATVSEGIASIAKPAVVLSQTFGHFNADGRSAVARAGIPLCLPGLLLGTTALRNLSWWSRSLGTPADPIGGGATSTRTTLPPSVSGTVSEWTARAVLTGCGAPCVPAELVQSADDAVAAWVRFGGPVALKLVSPAIAHKSDIGAVRLGLDRDGDVRHAYAAVRESVAADVAVEGVLVAPMRSGGIELLVGVTRDNEWGGVLVVGLGGIWVEALGDTATRVLPVTESDVEAMLRELAGARLLDGLRGAPPVDWSGLVAAVLAIADAAQAVGDRLVTLEVNPLLAQHDKVGSARRAADRPPGGRTAMTWLDEVEEIRRRRQMAEAMGGHEAVERQHAKGRLTIRERIDGLIDPGSFVEFGQLAGQATYEQGSLTSFVPEGYVAGLAAIGGRPVVVAGEDFTVRGGSGKGDAGTRLKRDVAFAMAKEYRIPLVQCLDGAGASIRSIEQLGRSYLPNSKDWTDPLELLGMVPVVGGILGAVAGGIAAYACLTHWTCMSKGAELFAAGPVVVRRALGVDVTKQELGGTEVHTRMSGVADNLADDEHDCFAQIARFLSYLPQNVWELPPHVESADRPDRREEELLSIIPREPRRPFDMRRLIELVVDEGSVFELKPFFGRCLITAFARMNGHAVGVVANDPLVPRRRPRRRRRREDDALHRVVRHVPHPPHPLRRRPRLHGGTRRRGRRDAACRDALPLGGAPGHGAFGRGPRPSLLRHGRRGDEHPWTARAPVGVAVR